MEDAVDVLTLKDNVTSVEDYTTALHLLARVQVKIGSRFRGSILIAFAEFARGPEDVGLQVGVASDIHPRRVCAPTRLSSNV
jgi:hypothetical protein